MLLRDSKFIGKPAGREVEAFLREFQFEGIRGGGRENFHSYEEGIGIICKDGTVRAIYTVPVKKSTSTGILGYYPST